MSPDDVDRRFRSLVETEFGFSPAAGGLASPSEPEDDVSTRRTDGLFPPGRSSHRRPAEPEPEPRPWSSSDPRAWEAPEEVDEPDAHKPEPLPPAPPVPGPVRAGLAVVVGGLLMLILRTVGVLPDWAGWVGLVTISVGVVALLGQLPRHRSDDGGDRGDGAVV